MPSCGPSWEITRRYASSRRSKGQTAAGHNDTAAEAELRRLIETNQIGKAVAKWASIGADLQLLLHIVDVCKINRMPSDLKLLLDHLRSSEEKRETAETKANTAAGSIKRMCSARQRPTTI